FLFWPFGARFDPLANYRNLLDREFPSRRHFQLSRLLDRLHYQTVRWRPGFDRRAAIASGQNRFTAGQREAARLRTVVVALLAVFPQERLYLSRQQGDSQYCRGKHWKTHRYTLSDGEVANSAFEFRPDK